MAKMFKGLDGKTMTTWNPFTGCKFDCSYCWAKKLATGKLAKVYPNGFVPENHPDRYNKKFKAGEFVFVSSMGDITFASDTTLCAINNAIENNPSTNFLLCTKSPSVYALSCCRQDNVYHGCTIETNRPYANRFSKAPKVNVRYEHMVALKLAHKFISIEPIMDFDLDIFVGWLKNIQPEIVEVGADNYHNQLLEPSSGKVKQLIAGLRQFVPTVIEKDGLARLL